VSPAIDEVVGFTRYRIEGVVDTSDGGEATITVVDRGGIARDLPLRTEQNPVLRGTKHQVAADQEVLVGRGRSDDRTIVIVPEIKDGVTTGITLLHVRFADRLSVAAARGVLAGYRRRLAALRDAVTETEPTFREDLLAEVPVIDMLTLPVSLLADRWRS
jgi:glutamine---fructose-6-phosphate transaminase (isomerizing)